MRHEGQGLKDLKDWQVTVPEAAELLPGRLPFSRPHLPIEHQWREQLITQAVPLPAPGGRALPIHLPRVSRTLGGVCLQLSYRHAEVYALLPHYRGALLQVVGTEA
ncbi:hypothetical protein CWT12_00405 [Actinomyces sp. 432]|nr:hypothetical protein CWT12_00405 [Actinomyces sp. 432]